MVEANPLSRETTSQKAELIALTRALTLANGKAASIYTDSKYAYHILHSHAAIWQERGFLSTKGSPITNGPLILHLLQAARLPDKAGVIHCKGHQKGTGLSSAGNDKADEEAK